MHSSARGGGQNGGTEPGGAPPRVAILGAGLMGRWHAHAAQRAGARVALVADPDPARAEALARRHPGATAVRDAAAALRPGLVDAAHVCSPLDTHAPLARAAVEAGIHALVEKPLTAGAAETRALLDAARRAGVVLCPVHQVAFQDGVARAATALGRLGAVSRITFDICSAGGQGRSGAALDEVVADILPHPLSVLLRLWPDARLEAAAWHVHHPGPGELLLSGGHAGALLTIAISTSARPTRFAMEAQCREGAVRLDFFHGFAVVLDGRTSRLRKATRPFADAGRTAAAAAANLARRGLSREPAYPGLRNLVQRFYAAARAGAPPPIRDADIIATAAARDDILAGLCPPTPRDRAMAAGGGHELRRGLASAAERPVP
ncbi:MAG: Gfo/Idh/MocA family oxidoreductase [Acetobacteraceae bacterium]|nr:Gfo/Idh/MocA family oxidoreductase [Acetobacteraceae bacterium]